MGKRKIPQPGGLGANFLRNCNVERVQGGDMRKLGRLRSGSALALLSVAALVGLAPHAGAQEAAPLPQEVAAAVPQEAADQLGVGIATFWQQVDEASAQVQAQLDEAQAQLEAQVGQVNADLGKQAEQARQQASAVAQQATDELAALGVDVAAGAQAAGATAGDGAQYFEPMTDGPDYHWRTDIASQILAGRPGPVLQRVQGSYFSAPDIPAESIEAEQRGVSLYGPGTPIYIGESGFCTVAFTGVDAAGHKVAITAGHCGQVGDAVASADSWRVGPSGTVVAQGANMDYSVIELGSNAQVTNSYNGVTVNQLGQGNLQPGQVACKQGISTGTTCGIVWSSNPGVQITQICAGPGDSGAPVMLGDRAVGMVNGGTLPFYELACRTPLQGALFMPTVSTPVDAILADLNAPGPGHVGFGLSVAG